MYRVTEEALEQIEFDGIGHVRNATYTVSTLYYRDANRSKHISEENSICNGTCTRLTRIFHGLERVPDKTTVEFVIDLLQNEYSDVPGGHYNHTKDLVLLLNYDINNFKANLQVRRYVSIYGTDVVRVLRCDQEDNEWVNVDLTDLLHNQIRGK